MFGEQNILHKKFVQLKLNTSQVKPKYHLCCICDLKANYLVIIYYKTLSFIICYNQTKSGYRSTKPYYVCCAAPAAS